jgi:AraC family transcriptional regulator, transcriptional activator of pobA
MKNTPKYIFYKPSFEAINGIHIAKLQEENTRNKQQLGDSFLFLMPIKGEMLLNCQNKNIAVNDNCMVVIQPFQVYSIQNESQNFDGFSIKVAQFLIPKISSEIIVNNTEKALHLEPNHKEILLEKIASLYSNAESQNQPKAIKINELIGTLMDCFVYFNNNTTKPTKELKIKSASIVANFKKLISIKTFLEDSDFFGQKLNINTSYLEDCVRIVTGKPIAFWLQIEILAEAQRQLYFTENNVKEIAKNLGFKNQFYFSRQFKKITKEKPIAFKQKFM